LFIDQYIAEIIEFGFKIPFIKVPSQIFCRNNSSARNHSNFVENAIRELLDAGIDKTVYMSQIQNKSTFTETVSGFTQCERA
jgi:hypothetical protein